MSKTTEEIASLVKYAEMARDAANAALLQVLKEDTDSTLAVESVAQANLVLQAVLAAHTRSLRLNA